MTRPKDKGTAAETMVVEYLRRTHWPHAERRALSGGKDKGDVTGTPGLAWEVKAAKTQSVPAWLRETEAERVNAGADYATLVIKPQGVGKERVASFHAVMDKHQFIMLFASAILAGPIDWVGDTYAWETTIRKVGLAEAKALTHLRKPPTANWWWVYYPTFVLTDLSQMAAMLNRAGYGTAVEVPR